MNEERTVTTAEIKAKAAAGEIEYSRTVDYFAADMGFDDAGILAMIASMEPEHFQKTMESVKHPGVVQHVYRVPYAGQEWYVKFTNEGPHGLRLISLKWRKALPQ